MRDFRDARCLFLRPCAYIAAIENDCGEAATPVCTRACACVRARAKANASIGEIGEAYLRRAVVSREHLRIPSCIRERPPRKGIRFKALFRGIPLARQYR